MTIEDAIAANIRARRARASISQGQVSAEMLALGYSAWLRQAVSMVENGKRRVAVAELVALAQVLGCTPAALIDLSEAGDVVTFPSGKPVGP